MLAKLSDSIKVSSRTETLHLELYEVTETRGQLYVDGALVRVGEMSRLRSAYNATLCRFWLRNGMSVDESKLL